jgi:hypothetical protein
MKAEENAKKGIVKKEMTENEKQQKLQDAEQKRSLNRLVVHVQEEQTRMCEACLIPVSLQNWTSHLLSNKHKKNEAPAKFVDFTNGDPFFQLLSLSGDFLCILCDVVVSALENYRSHINGKNHTSKQLGLQNNFYCDVCDISLPIDCAHTHRLDFRHCSQMYTFQIVDTSPNCEMHYCFSCCLQVYAICSPLHCSTERHTFRWREKENILMKLRSKLGAKEKVVFCDLCQEPVKEIEWSGHVLSNKHGRALERASLMKVEGQ